MFDQKTVPESLAAWLAIATGDLVPSAQTRVSAEIEVHYAEAVQAHLASGSSEAIAHAAALADLGEAPRAAQRYRREYLTHHDAVAIGSLHPRATRRHFACCVWLLLIYLPNYFLHPQLDFIGIFCLCILIGMSTPDIYFGRINKRWLAAIDRPPENVRRVLERHFLLNSVVLVAVMLASLLYRPIAYEPLSYYLPPMMIAVLLFSEFRLYRLRQKLQILYPCRQPTIVDGSRPA